jgi:UDP-glucose/iron transport system permease protein
VSGLIEIGALDLILATMFIVVVGGLSIVMALGLVRSFFVATLRTYLQLLALGFVLRWIFDLNEWWVVLIAIVVMILAAVHTILPRVKQGPRGIARGTFVAVFTSGLTVTFAVTGIIVSVDPWYDARYVIPIAGMIFGASMTGIAIALERLFSDLRRREDEIWTLLALGATRWEASIESIRSALTAGLIPTINAMCAVGIVHIPGMMTGQVLAGADPVIASRYQIVVMLMIAAATALGAIIAVGLCYGRAFDDEDRLTLRADAGKRGS